MTVFLQNYSAAWSPARGISPKGYTIRTNPRLFSSLDSPYEKNAPASVNLNSYYMNYKAICVQVISPHFIISHTERGPPGFCYAFEINARF